MRLARVRFEGHLWLARVEHDTVGLLHRESDHPAADALREALAAGVDLADETARSVSLSAVSLAAPVIRPSKVLAIGLNYADHVREAGVQTPSAPLVFAKAPSSIIGPGDTVRFRREDSREVDYEAELAVVVGIRVSGVVEDPLAAVLGFTICNDVSARDAQFSDGQWARGKSFDTFCPLGPWIVTPDELVDFQSARIRCTIDGETLQDGTTADMIFRVAELVAYIARFMTLEPGDVIATGTPFGVGFARTPPRYLQDGEKMTCWIEGIGELVNPVVVE